MPRTPDESAIKMMRRIVEHINPRHAEVHFDQAPAHPLFGGQRYIVGHEYGRPRTLESLHAFLGDKGYIDYVRWVPDWQFQGMSFNDVPSHWEYVSFGIRDYDSSIWMTNTYLHFPHHQIGLSGTRFTGNREDIDLRNPSVTRRHMADTEDEMFNKVVELIMAR